MLLVFAPDLSCIFCWVTPIGKWAIPNLSIPSRFATRYHLANLSNNFSYVDLLQGGKPCPIGSKFQVGDLSRFTFLLVEALRDEHVWLNSFLFAKHLGGAYNNIQFVCDEAYFLRGSYDGEYITITQNNSSNGNNNIWTTMSFIGIKLNL